MNDNDKNEYNFINEKVVRKRKSLKELFKNGGFFCIEALAFGILAAVAFAWMEPRADILLNGEEEPVINLNNTTTENIHESVTGTGTDTEPATSENEKNVLSKNILDKIHKSMVVISSKSTVQLQQRDKKSSVTETSGIIINADKNILILTDYGSVKNSDIISVTFDNDVQCVAEIRKYDEQMDMAILRVNTEDMFAEDDKPVAAVLGNSAGISEGDILTYAGVSQGAGKISCKCNITAAGSKVQFTDCVYGIYMTDLNDNVAANGFLYNNRGQMVGMISSVNDENIPNLVTSLGISEIKAVIEKLSNGRTLPYVGITGTTVTDDLISRLDNGMPYGVYVNEVDAGSPAYLAGIVKGDIIISIGNTAINSVEDYSYVVNSLNSGNKVDIIIERKGQNDYKKISYTVTVNRKNTGNK